MHEDLNPTAAATRLCGSAPKAVRTPLTAAAAVVVVATAVVFNKAHGRLSWPTHVPGSVLNTSSQYVKRRCCCEQRQSDGGRFMRLADPSTSYVSRGDTL